MGSPDTSSTCSSFPLCNIKHWQTVAWFHFAVVVSHLNIQNKKEVRAAQFSSSFPLENNVWESKVHSLWNMRKSLDLYCFWEITHQFFGKIIHYSWAGISGVLVESSPGTDCPAETTLTLLITSNAVREWDITSQRGWSWKYGCRPTWAKHALANSRRLLLKLNMNTDQTL